MQIGGIKQKPRTRNLIIINGFAWCMYFAISIYDATGFGSMLLVVALVITLAITTLGQVVIHFTLRKKNIQPFFRTLLFFVPSLLMVVLVLVLPEPPPHDNQIQDLASPSGEYVLAVPIERNTTNPDYRNTRVWKVTIRNADGRVEYKDEASTFVGYLNVYWIWDQDDRVWLYNSDDGHVYFWERAQDAWLKHLWGYGQTKDIPRDIMPPDNLYPGYVE